MFVRILNYLAVLCCAAQLWADDLVVKVVDPGAALVSGAHVLLLRPGQTETLAVRTTTAQGVATFRALAAGAYRVRVLAPGFADKEAGGSAPGAINVQLRVAAAEENVFVTTTRFPLPSEDTGAETAELNAAELENMQPTDAANAIRFLPGAVVNDAGRRGGISSLFVRGGDSRYNKVIVDGVVVNDPGGTFDFGVVPMTEVERLEFVRGAQSTLYGSDAMTSVVQTWSHVGSTRSPEVMFGADGGTFSTAHGYLSISGARGRFDYNLFADQFNTQGQGANDDYSNSLQGANLGAILSPRVRFRLRARHSNNRSGVQSFWNFNGLALVPPDLDQRARQNNFLAGADLTVSGKRSEHRFTGFEYHHVRYNVDDIQQAGRVTPAFGGFNFDSPFSLLTDINRGGFEYQGQYWERSWAQTTFGYRFEDENGFTGDLATPPPAHGVRLNHDVYAQQFATLGRVSLVGGLRFVHNGSFGNKLVPRVALSLVASRGGRWFSGTRLRGSYATGIKEPRLEETFATGPFEIPNPNLRAEQNRALDAGIEQKVLGGKYILSATYFNNRFRDQIEFATDPATFVGQYTNVKRSLAHGAELQLGARLSSRLALQSSYTYTATQILAAPLCTPANFCDPLLAAGQALLRRPRHSGTGLLNYSGRRWGGELGGTLVGRRLDSDFLGLVPHVDHAAGYGRVDVGGWYAFTSKVTAYIAVENALNRHYEEVAGYPALRANFRAGMRFRIGAE
jgi:vitamin B12 transporter